MSEDIDGLLGALNKAAKNSPTVSVPPSHPEGWLYQFWRDAWRMDVEPQPHAEMAGFVEASLGDCSFSGTLKLSSC